jgi:ankyrin repeat protein
MRKLALLLLIFGCGVRPNPELTPLIVAARQGDAGTVRNLIAHGADPNEPAGNNNWTPLLHAIHRHQPGAVAALLDGGADVNRLGGDGMTPLMMAAGYGYADIVQILLRRGANPRIADGKGFHAIDLAVAGIPDIDRFTLFHCQHETVRLLRAADPSIRLHSEVATWGRLKRCGR